MELADARADGKEAGEGSEGNCATLRPAPTRSAALMGECVECPR